MVRVDIKKSEILAPAGKMESLEAAVKAGCDAVYLGGDRGGARAYAGNFSAEELISAIRHCHFYGVKVYMTVNTLFKNEELNGLADYIRPFYFEGLDAVLVQDMGVFKLLKETFPDLPLHASTQTSITTPEGAGFFKNIGFSRIVPARELSLSQIKTIKESVDIEIETFVHGAMCFAYSGRCLMSSFFGGRSGNRGRCAQPCRKIYEIEDSDTKEYMMSLKDMQTLGILPELIEAGIDSFKIEGRMKNPSYVAATVSAYKEARDRYLENGKRYSDWSKAERSEYSTFIDRSVIRLKDIYNRGGFSTGYYHRHNGYNMIASERPNHAGVHVGVIEKVKAPDLTIKLRENVSPGDVLEIRNSSASGKNDVEITCNVKGSKGKTIKLKGKEFRKITPGASVYRTRNNALLKEIEETILKPEKTISAKAEVSAKEGEPLLIKIYNDQVKVELEGDIVERASRRPVTEADILQKMSRTGGSGVRLDICCEVDEDIFIPASKLNDLRREAVEKFKEAVEGQYRRNI